MGQATLIFILCGILFGCGQKEVSDVQKLAELERRCNKQSSEYITENSADGAINLSSGGYAFGVSGTGEKPFQIIVLDKFHYSSEPLGSANLPALDLEYAPAFLLETLFMGPDALSEVSYTFYTDRPVASPVNKNCPYGKSVMVRNQADSRATFLHKCDPGRVNHNNELARYTVSYAYGNIDDFEIRPFMFWITDRTNGRVLAEQHSFQLLLGGMKEKVNRSRHGWGSSQGVLNCRLTPPDQVIKRVVRGSGTSP
ncbi:hypothetical protein [Thiobacillus sp.]|uniref:hypothetical protein n=1 Tax=Thiobacillus sp. TaxID=924 RepID=UPI00286DD2F6|nr:hypothetical protein [Thiobacillus sp.]